MNPGSHPVRAGVSFIEALKFWVKLGFINFGGPAGQIAIMQHELVDSKRWVPQSQFLRALNFCMILPGPEAQQLAVYIGWRLHGILGGVVAGSFFVIPSIFVLLALSWMVVVSSDVPAIRGLLYGVQPVVIAIVASAVLRIGKKTLRHWGLGLFAWAAFVALYFFNISFPYVIGTAALGGTLLQRFWPHIFQSCEVGHDGSSTCNEIEDGSPNSRPSMVRNLKLLTLFLVLWGIPVGGLWLWRGPLDVLVQESILFSKAAFVTFGGAYAVLSYIADMAVNHYGWLNAHQMVQGLGLAESTPGPLIMVTQYIGFIAAWNLHGEFNPLFNAVLGAVITTYMTFLPCFFFIFLGAPYIELLSANRLLQAALVGVASAVVGVIVNLGVFFGQKVLFPSPGVFDYFAAALALASFGLALKFRIQMHYLVPVGALAGMTWHLLGYGVS
ncbi:MAG: chromate efflux transporter [Deltaproteobacteria bacterium]|nr:chromate efflux transporter [Deltaproteobacteria bacterium]MBF0527109.1 chromate efflux transporter [Deltaproteobacteria bacterium]